MCKRTLDVLYITSQSLYSKAFWIANYSTVSWTFELVDTWDLKMRHITFWMPFEAVMCCSTRAVIPVQVNWGTINIKVHITQSCFDCGWKSLTYRIYLNSRDLCVLLLPLAGLRCVAGYVERKRKQKLSSFVMCCRMIYCSNVATLLHPCLVHTPFLPDDDDPVKPELPKLLSSTTRSPSLSRMSSPSWPVCDTTITERCNTSDLGTTRHTIMFCLLTWF